MTHESVLLHEALRGLAITKGDVYVDATINGGGHSAEVARVFGDTVSIVGIDMDSDALARSRERLSPLSKKVTLIEGNFRNMEALLTHNGVPHADKILFDLGWNAHQFEESGRGFSFNKNEPLSMTFAVKPEEGSITAYDIVNEWDEEHLVDIISAYGEERYTKRIARAIVEYRDHAPIETTDDLVSIITSAVPSSYRHGKIHPATRTFQALRITVNDELRALQEGLDSAWNILSKGGRMAVISFHSLEDRIVKRTFKKFASMGGNLITKKPIVATPEEVLANRRSRSAKMRIIEKNI